MGLLSLSILSPFTRISELSTNNNNIHVKVSDMDAIQDLVFTFCPKEAETLDACIIHVLNVLLKFVFAQKARSLNTVK